MSHARSQVIINSPPEPHNSDASASKKRKLDFVKCVRCRHDKQKCEPEDRQWPQKCGRCEKNRWPCSEGTKKIRASRLRHRMETRTLEQSPNLVAADAQISSAPARGVDDLTNPANSTLDDHSPELKSEDVEFRCWTFLMSFHRNTIMAVNALDTLRCKTLALFGLSAVDLKYFPAGFQLPPERSFLDFVSRIDEEVRTRSLRLVRNQQPGTMSNILCTSLIDTIALPPNNGIPNFCSICTPKDNEYILREELQKHLDPIGSFLVSVRQLAVICSRHPHLDYCLEVMESYSAAKTQAISILGDPQLLETLPPESSKSLLFIRDRIAEAKCSYQQEDPYRVDCLGRTSLHRELDATESVSPRDSILICESFPRLAKYQDLLGRSALHIACQNSQESLVEALLRSGADINCRTFFGSTPLQHAVISDKDWKPVVDLLADKGLDINALDNARRSALWYAVDKADKESVIDLLNDPRIHVDFAGVDRLSISQGGTDTPLSRAVWHGLEDIVELLLDHGANPNGNVFCSPIWSCVESTHRSADILHLLAVHSYNKINDCRSGNRYTSPLAHIASKKWKKALRFYSISIKRER